MPPKFDISGKSVWVAGESGMVGQAMVKTLADRDCKLISAPHSVLDLTDQQKTYDFLAINKPDVVIMSAAKVGGIGANMNAQADFLFQNLSIAQNVIHGSFQADVKKLVYLGSSCIYPRNADQPINEEALLTGELEKTNEGYALAKIAGLKLCQYYRQQYGCDYISAMPTNLYGINDHFDEEKSHVIPAMIKKFHQAKIQNKKDVILWGTGKALREFLYVDDLSKALLCLLENYSDISPVNIGSGEEISISDLANMIKKIVSFDGEIKFDKTKPDGTPRKILDSSKINNLGWNAETPLNQGLQKVYEEYLKKFSSSLAA